MDYGELGFKVFQAISPLLIAALTWVVTKVAQLVQGRVKSEYLRGALVRLDDAVIAVVREVHQVTVEEIKAASADGKLTPEERARIKAKAMETVRSHLGAKGVTELAQPLRSACSLRKIRGPTTTLG